MEEYMRNDKMKRPYLVPLGLIAAMLFLFFLYPAGRPKPAGPTILRGAFYLLFFLLGRDAVPLGVFLPVGMRR
jgi:hypothetical protein